MRAARMPWAEIDSYVEKYELGRLTNPTLDARACLPSPDHPFFLQVLCELACVEMELEARAGREPTLDDYRFRFPELFADPDSVAALARQELRLRNGAGEPPSNERSVASWQEQAAALFAEYRQRDETAPVTVVVGSVAHAELLLRVRLDRAEAGDPLAAGGEWGGFRLLEVLGRGSFGTVFLAEQKGLANRQVAIKIGEGLDRESEALARLLHTHIMPIHSVHHVEDRVGVCMPFLGRITLGDVLSQMRRHAPPVGSNALSSTLIEHLTQPTTKPDADEQKSLPTSAPLAALQKLDHPRAVLWLANKLADGLAHAHERGVLHRDLKPANVLLTDDGQPLLLDFNLAGDIRLRGGLPAVLGGTLPYMAPEHLQAFHHGALPVDERSDLFSLGVILYELLTGQHPYPIYQLPLSELLPKMVDDRLAGPPPFPPGTNASPATVAIVRRCLDPDPAKRYSSARQLQEDAQHQLDDLPLKHTPEPSMRERLTKWKRRHPRLLWVGLASILTVLLACLLVGYVVRSREAARASASNAVRLAREDLREGSVRLAQPFLDPADVESASDSCQRGLQRLGLLAEGEPLPALPAAERSVMRATAAELLLLSARALSSQARFDVSRKDELLKEALERNERAEQFADADQRRAVLIQRVGLLEATGRGIEADLLRIQVRAAGSESARDYYLLASEHLARGELAEARKLLQESIRRQPDSASAWVALGTCESASGRYERAISCFTTALALLPESWWVWFWRGQAHLERHDYASAVDDFSAVLELRADHAPALVLRAVARIGKKEYRAAETDLTDALALETGNNRIYLLRARARSLAGNGDGAKADRDSGLRLKPTDELSWVSRGYERMQDDPKGALADFDEALKLNPFSREATQNKAHVLSEKLRRPKEAIAALDRRLTRFPDDALLRASRGVLKARQGLRDEALKDARAALEGDAGPVILFQVGSIYALTSTKDTDDRDEAFRWLRRALIGGFGSDLLATDPDLKAIRKLPRFRELTELAKSLADR